MCWTTSHGRSSRSRRSFNPSRRYHHAGRLTGKVAFITGAARGQGRAHAVRLAREGADILALDIATDIPDIHHPSPSIADLEQTQPMVEGLDRRIVIHQGDVRDLDDMSAFVTSGIPELGRLDIVIANAGICTPETWDKVNPAMFRDTIDVNLTGVWNTVMAMAPTWSKPDVAARSS